MSNRSTPPFFVDFKENPGFLGREADLAAVHHALHAQPANGTREAVGIVPAGLTGMGGIGKTQLAVKYVYAYREHYPDGIYWLNGANSLYQEFADLGRRLQGMEADYATQKRLFNWLKESFDEGELRTLCFDVHVKFDDLLPGGLQDKVRELVTHLARRGKLAMLEGAILAARPHLQAEKTSERRDPALDELVRYAFSWLQNRPQALLVLDNLEKPEQLHEPLSRDWIVSRLPCRVLFSTRRNVLPGCQSVALTVLPEDVALQLLLRYRPNVLVATHPEHKTAQTICHSLGYLPLALEVASAHLKLFPNAPLRQYQAELQQRGMLTVLEDERAAVKTLHETGLQAVLLRQWQQLPSEESRRLLRVAGQLPEAAQIPTARLGLLASVPEEGKSFFDMTLNTALVHLVDASLLEKLTVDLVRLHPLIRDFISQHFTLEIQKDFRVAMGDNLASSFEDFYQFEKQASRRGVEAVQDDLRTIINLLEPPRQSAIDWIGVPPWYAVQEKQVSSLGIGQTSDVPERLKLLLMLLQREMHTLRGWQPEQQPVFFTQQMAFRAQSKGLEKVFPKVLSSLQKKIVPYIQLLWRKPMESPTLELIISRQSDEIQSVAVTTDGQRVISATYHGNINVWNLFTGVEEHDLGGQSNWIKAIAIVPQSQQVILALNFGSLSVWNLEQAKEVQRLKGHLGDVNGVAVTPDGQRVVSVADDGKVIVWNLKTGTIEHSIEGHLGSVKAVAVTPNGQRAVSASMDRTLKVWNLEKGVEERTLRGHSNRVNAVAVTPDGRCAISASSDCTLKVWNLETGAEMRTLSGHSGYVNAVVITPDGQRALSASCDCTVKVWHLETGMEEYSLRGHYSWVMSVAITPDGHRAITASYDCTLRAWNLERKAKWETNSNFGKIQEVLIATLLGRQLLLIVKNHKVQIFNLKTGVEDRRLKNYFQDVKAVAVTADGKRAAVASQDMTLKMLNLENGIIERSLFTNSSQLRSMAISTNGQQAVVASYDGSLKVWNLESGNVEWSLNGHSRAVTAVAISSKGQLVISASEDGTLKVWNLENGKEKRTLDGHSGSVRGVAVTADGRLAVSASDDKSLKVWNLHTGEAELTLNGHSASVRAVAVSADGRLLVSASADWTLKIWNLYNGTLLSSIQLDGPLDFVSIEADGVAIATGDRVGNVYCLQYIEPISKAN